MLPLQVLELKLVIGNLLVSLIEENSPDSLIVAMVNLSNCLYGFWFI